MERNFTDENLEQFLRQNADGLRMRPSDKVWNGISRHLNRRRRKFGFLLAAALLITSATGYYMLETTASNNKTTASGGPASTINNGKETKAFFTKDLTAGNTPGITAKQTTKAPGLNQKSRNVAENNNLIAGLSSSNFTLASNIQQPDVIEPVALNEFQPTVVDSYPGAEDQNPPASKKDNKQSVTDLMSIESVVNSYAPKIKKGKLGLQFFFTPTVSYRRLSENKAYTSSSNALLGVYDLKSAVKHKPNFGFQVGVLAKYPVAKNVKLRGGFQFNLNRYDIKTFNSYYELATIQFNNRQSVNAVTGYNNFNGYKSDWLENFYFQASVPLGIELKLGGNRKTEVGIATSVQPTYLIGDRAYLISTDYKNYMEVPSLVRKWNVNTSFETYVSYTTGRMKWQVGPQVRYQVLSSYEKKYPIKENLFDFGLRVGMSLNRR